MIIARRLSLVLCLVATCFAAHARQPAAEIDLMVASIEQSLPDSVALLEEVVNINSGTMNFAGVKQVGEIFAREFDALGFSTRWEDGGAFDRAGHVIAEHTASVNSDSATKIMLIGHLDTVFAKDDAFNQMTRIDDRYIAGPGITDMKGGVVIMLSAIRALNAAGLLDQISLRVVLTGDEEHSGEPLSLSKQALTDGAAWADIALGFEDGDGNVETAVIARRGSIDWQLEVSGQAAHSSQIFQPDVGAGAIFEVARILDGWRRELDGYGNLTFNPGRMAGGTSVEHNAAAATVTAFGKTNVVAQTVQAFGGLRASSPEELAHAKKVMQAVVDAHLPKTDAVVTFADGYPPMAPTEANRALLALYSQASEDLGFGPVVAVNPRNAGAADISFAASQVDMALDGLGLMGRGGHTKDEVADMSTLTQNAKKAALLMARLIERTD